MEFFNFFCGGGGMSLVPDNVCDFCREPLGDESPKTVGELRLHKRCVPIVEEARENFKRRFAEEDARMLPWK